MTSRVQPLGQYGVWLRGNQITPQLAKSVEALGFGALWVGGSPAADLKIVESALAASEHLVVATGIINIWRADPTETATSYHRIEARYPGRLLLGFGSGHREADASRRTPVRAVEEYLDVLDAEGVPPHRRILSALGPKMLRLATARSLGSHPYLTVPAHTAWAREVLGPAALLSPEVTITLATDPIQGRAIGRQFLRNYLRMVNYTSTMLRWGFTASDLEDGGSDRLIDELTPWGDVTSLAAAASAQLAAGASHVPVQVLANSGDDPLRTLEALSEEVFN